MKSLNEMNKKELSDLALEKGLTLSYKDTDEKRKRYTMQQLIEMIENTFETEKGKEVKNANHKSISTTNMYIEKLEMSSLYGKLGNEVAAPEAKQDKKVYDLKTVLNDLQKITDLITLKTFKNEVYKYFAAIDKTLKKKSLKKHMANELNKITYVIKLKELKL